MDLLSPDKADPSIQAASVVWARSIDINVTDAGNGQSEVIIAYHFLSDDVSVQATIANDGPKTTTVQSAQLIRDGTTPIKLFLNIKPTLAPNGGSEEITAKVNPADFWASAADALGCKVINGQCKDITLPVYKIQVIFSSGKATPQIVEAGYDYLPVATCPVEQIPPEPCPRREP